MENKTLLSALEHLQILARREYEAKVEDANRTLSAVVFIEREIEAVKAAIKKADEKKETEVLYPLSIDASFLTDESKIEETKQEESSSKNKLTPRERSINAESMSTFGKRVF